MPRKPTTPDLGALERHIGIRFKNRQLLLTALTHRSYLNEHRDAAEHNERLEFLGDAVLEMAVTYHLYRTVDANEGRMTNLRVQLVQNRHLAEIGRQLSLGQFLRMSRGERNDFETNGKSAQRLLGCAMEALIGAIRVDRGPGIAELFVHEFVLPRLETLHKKDTRDPKSMLQELVQEQWHVTPTYRTLTEEGPDHDRKFTVGVYFGRKPVDIGSGSSKAEAEMNAAIRALRDKFDIHFDEKTHLVEE